MPCFTLKISILFGSLILCVCACNVKSGLSVCCFPRPVRYEVSIAFKIRTVVFWVETFCRVGRGFQEVLGSQISWHAAHEGGEVSLTHRSPLPPGMFLVLIFTRSWVGRNYVTEKSSDTTGNRSRDRPTSSAAPQPLRYPRPPPPIQWVPCLSRG